jgi:hypothetical protein
MAESEAELTEIPASEILDKIQKGEPVKYNCIRIIGDLDANELDLPTKRVDSIDGKECKVVSTSIEITSSTFNGKANFRSIFFDASIDFTNTTFSRNANFGSASFSGGAYFGGVSFNGDAFFSRSRFDYIVYFNAKFCKRINLDESKIYSMHLSEATFENASTISLRFSDITRLEVQWKSIRDKIEYDGTAYLLLVKTFNNLELFNDADECYYQYRTFRRRRGESLEGIIPKLLDYVAWIAYGYGVRPGNPLILSLGLFLISIIVFASGFGLKEPLGSVINATYLSVFVFTSSPKTDPLTGLYGIWGMIERIAGWLLMACFLVVLAKKTLR